MKSDSISQGRRILTIFVAVMICLLIVFGTISLTLNEMFSKSMIKKTVSSLSLETIYGRYAVDAVNVGIMHLTDSAYTDSLYLTQDTITDVFDERAVKEFFINKLSEFGRAIVVGTNAEWNAKELVPLFDGLRNHIKKEVNITLTDEDIIKEISLATGGENHVLDKSFKFISPWLAVAALAFALLLIMFEYAASYPSVRNGSVVCIIALVAASMTILVISFLAIKLNVSAILEVLGGGIVQKWLGFLPVVLRRNALLILLGIIPLVVILCLKIADDKRIRREA